MKKIIFLLMITVGVVSCEKENFNSADETLELNDKLEENNFEKSAFIETDGSGQIEMSFSTPNFISTKVQTGVAKGKASVPDGFLCIGGTVWAKYDQYDPGALITKSAPSTSLTSWESEAKDHSVINRYGFILVGSARGIRLKDNDGNYIPPNVLKNYIKVVSKTSSIASQPETSIQLPSGYTLISGGAKVNWSGRGNLLTGSFPFGNGWKATSKDHEKSSPASITVYAIGIANNIPNFGSIRTTRNSDCEYTTSGVESASVSLSSSQNDYVACGGGASASYNGFGRMLYAIGVGNGNSKDHLRADGGNTCAYLLAIKKE
ncbi:hypothetical protein D1818_07785 [Aquimarina sp. BL5]|uniref:hypothetical protein n=1 Tax=Aquimarina sp. BL5 TaxID=1714860 RepID=UPI000E5186C3|nr:hypothetical protein [Aquimarina sp. BL5]AXT50733.1 hypothetical protein D1818_07785 [Aquimarina sp. BL5]RKN08244.1 hypothetical protein D7036_06380 [Aquimarina sp. BL5]